MILLFCMNTVAAGPLETGRYRMTLHAATRTRVPVLGWTPSSTISQVLVDLWQEGNTWTQRHQVCDVDVISGGTPARTVIPDAFVAALPIKEYPIEVVEEEGLWRYQADLGVDHLGYDPLATQGRVPRKADDKGVTDPDGDGNPGVTVVIDIPVFGQAALYVVQQGSMALDGTVYPDGTIEGQLSLGPVNQRTVGATNPFFKASPPIRPVEALSWFRLEPDPTATCSDFVASVK